MSAATNENNEQPKLIDLERLQHLSYERSKLWAAFLDNIHESENQREISLEHIDEFLDEEPEDEDDLASMEDDVCDDDVDPEVLRDITNTTRLSLMINGNNKSVLPPATSPNEAKNELIDMLNETLPVINEHNRQMKESGLDRVLNTFDAKKIEEKVGGWLRRHNSLCAEPEDSFIPMPNPPNKHLKNSLAMEHFYRTPTVCRPPHINYHQEDSTDSDDSFNSGETARYIRSSRNGAIKNSASTTMMIKTYRMFKSTRQALRDKYACDQDEVADSHLNELRLRRRLAKESALRHCQQKHMSARSYKTMYPQYITPLSHPTHTRRRKIYRKRTVSNSNSTMDDDTSSESDSCYYGEIGRHSHRKQHQACCSQRHCVAYNAPPVLTSAVKRSQYSAMKKVPNLIHNDCTYYYLKTHKPPSPPSPNALPRKGMKKALKRLDNRPYRRESECRCCDDNRLCKKYKHLADTSTEEWVVENCSPKKSPMLTSTQLPLETNPNPNTISKHQEEQFSTNKESEETSIWNRDETPTKIKEATRKNHNVENKKEPEASETVIPGEAAKTPKIVSQNKKRGRKKKNTSEIPKADDSFDLQLQIALKESVELYKKEQMKEKEKRVENTSPQSKSCNTDIVTKDDHVFAKPEIPVLNSVATQRMSSILGTEETFFDMKVVYNSTSLSDNRTARSKLRELNGHHKEENEDATNETSKKQNRLAKKVRRSISIQTEEDHTTSTEQLQVKDIKEDDDNQSVVVHNRLPRDFEDDDDLKDQGNRCQETIDNKTKDTEDVGTDQEQNGEFVINSKKNISEWEGMKPVNNTAEYFAREENQKEESIFTADTSKVKKSKGAKKPKQVLVEQNKSKGVTTSKRLLSSKKEISVTGLTFELENTATNASIGTKKKLSIHRHHPDSESGEENKPNSDGDTMGALKPDHTNTTNSRNGLSKAESPLEIVKKRGPRKKSATKTLSSSDNEHSKTNESQSKKTNKSKNSKQHKELSKKKTTSKRQINETEAITEEDHGLHSNGDRINNKNDLIPTKLLKKAVSNTTNQESNRNEYHSNQKLTTEEDTSCSDKKEERPQRKHKSIAEQTITREPTTKSKTANNNSNVTSTTTMLHSPESQDESRRTNKILSRRRMVALPDSESKYDDNNNNDDIDCTVVTSTTHIETVDEIEVPEETKSTSSSFSSSSASSSQTVIRKPTMITNVSPKDSQSNLTRYDPNKGILIYTPHNSSLAPDHSLSKDGGFFNITLEHLSTIIGQKPAEKFLKYYIGRRRFNSKSTVYFRPPATGVQDTSEDSTSDSDDDDLEFIGRYGDLYESFGGSEGGGHHVV